MISFDYCSESVWEKLNKDDSFLSGSRQSDIAFDVCYEMIDIIQDIAKQAGSLASHECAGMPSEFEEDWQDRRPERWRYLAA